MVAETISSLSLKKIQQRCSKVTSRNATYVSGIQPQYRNASRLTDDTLSIVLSHGFKSFYLAAHVCLFAVRFMVFKETLHNEVSVCGKIQTLILGTSK